LPTAMQLNCSLSTCVPASGWAIPRWA